MSGEVVYMKSIVHEQIKYIARASTMIMLCFGDKFMDYNSQGKLVDRYRYSLHIQQCSTRLVILSLE